MSLFALTYTDTELSILYPLTAGYRRARVVIPEGLVVSGAVADQDKFAELIKQTLAGNNLPLTKQLRVAVGLPEEHAFVKAITVPSTIKAKELTSAFAYQWQSIMPIGMDQVYFEYLELKSTEKKSPTRRYLVVAYPKAAIDSLVGSLTKLGLLPVRLIPLSFGVAELFAPGAVATLAISSEDGKTISIAVIQHGTTRLSTVIHSRIDSPSAYRQIETIKNFYDQSVTNPADKVNHVLIIRSRFAETMAQQLANLKLPIQVSQVDTWLAAKAGKKSTHVDPYAVPVQIEKVGEQLKIRGAASYMYEADHYTPLFGLLHTKSMFSIFPLALKDKIHGMSQVRILRSSFVVALVTLGLTVSVSVMMLRNLKASFEAQTRVAPTLIDQVTKEENELAKQVTEANTLASRFVALSAKRSTTLSTVRQVQDVAKSVPGITLTGITYSAEKKTITLNGNRSDRAALTKLVDQLKTVKGVTSPTPSLASFQDEGSSLFEITLTMGGKS